MLASRLGEPTEVAVTHEVLSRLYSVMQKISADALSEALERLPGIADRISRETWEEEAPPEPLRGTKRRKR